MRELRPLDDSLPVPQRELAQALRVLFANLDVSLTRYSVRVHLDKSVVSRYLSGERIPPWSFVRELLVGSTERRDGAAPTADVLKHLKGLYQQALASGNSPSHTILLLEEELAEADREAVRAAARTRDIEETLQDTRQRLAQLAVNELELEAERDADRDAHTAELALYDAEINDLRQQHGLLFQKIQRLAEELHTAQRRRLSAERRCTALELELEAATAISSSAIGAIPTAIINNAIISGGSMTGTIVVPAADSPGPPVDFVHLGRLAAQLDRAEPAEAAHLVQQLEAGRAAGALDRMAPARVASLLALMDLDFSAAALVLMDLDRAAAALNLAPPDQAAAHLDRMGAAPVVEFMNQMGTDQAAEALFRMHSITFSDIAGKVTLPLRAHILDRMGPDLISAALDSTFPQVPGPLPETFWTEEFLEEADPGWISAALDRLTPESAAARVARMDRSRGVSCLNHMAPPQVAAVLNQLDPPLAAGLMCRLKLDRLADVEEQLDPLRRAIARQVRQGQTNGTP